MESFGPGFSTANFLDSNESNCYIFLIAIRESESKWKRHGNTTIKYGSSISYGSTTTTAKSAVAWPTNTIGPFMWAMWQSVRIEGKARVASLVLFFTFIYFPWLCNQDYVYSCFFCICPIIALVRQALKYLDISSIYL